MSMHIVPPNVWKVERDKLIWIYTRGPARRAMQGLQHQLHRGEKSHNGREQIFLRKCFFWLEEIDLCALQYIRQAASHQAMQKGHQERVVVIILSFSLGAGLVTLAWGKCYNVAATWPLARCPMGEEVAFPGNLEKKLTIWKGFLSARKGEQVKWACCKTTDNDPS